MHKVLKSWKDSGIPYVEFSRLVVYPRYLKGIGRYEVDSHAAESLIRLSESLGHIYGESAPFHEGKYPVMSVEIKSDAMGYYVYLNDSEDGAWFKRLSEALDYFNSHYFVMTPSQVKLIVRQAILKNDSRYFVDDGKVYRESDGQFIFRLT